jgi:hypothetical protein
MIDGFSTRTPQQALAALLDQQAPASLLLLGASEFPALQAFAAAHPLSVITHVAPGPLPAEVAGRRFDLALAVDCLEHLPKRDGLRLLAGIRNLNAGRLAVLADRAACGWSDTDFYSTLQARRAGAEPLYLRRARLQAGAGLVECAVLGESGELWEVLVVKLFNASHTKHKMVFIDKCFIYGAKIGRSW